MTHWTAKAAALAASLLLALGAAAAADAPVDTFTEAGFRSGAEGIEALCDTAGRHVWVPLEKGGGECIEYYVAGTVDPKRPVAVYFSSDKFRWRDWDRNGWITKVTYPEKEAYRGAKTRADVNEWLTSLSEAGGAPLILVARPGMYGSTGRHGFYARTWAELEVVDGALDRIAEKLGVSTWVLTGSSGGAGLAAMLLSRRGDIACAALSSGLFLEYERRMRKGSRTFPRNTFYDPIDGVPEIPRDPARRIFLIGDPRDTNTLFESQQAYFEALLEAGHDARLIEAKGRGKKHHRLGREAIAASLACAAGKSDDEIREAIKRTNNR